MSFLNSTQLPPGPKGSAFSHELVRNTLRDPLPTLTQLKNQYGDILCFRAGLSYVYLLSSPDLVHEVLVRQASKVQKTQSTKRSLRIALGEGLLVSDGDFHRQQRTLLQPAFHYQRIATYGTTMTSRIQHMLDQWNDKETLNIHSEMTYLTLGIVTECLFGANVPDDVTSIGSAMEVMQTSVNYRLRAMLPIPIWMPTSENLRFHRMLKVIDGIVMEIINERRQLSEDKGDLLSMLLLAADDEKGMTNRQIRDEAVTLFLAGHETTANAMAWTWYLLSRTPAVRTKLDQELDQVLQGRPPDILDLANLRYTERVIKEAMRLYPPVWMLGRTPKVPIEVGGFTLPTRAKVLMSPYIIHHDERNFTDPEEFCPDRFAEEAGIAQRLTFLPFGGGPRVCIGQQFAMMEAKLILAMVAQSYHLDLIATHDIRPSPLVTLRPSEPINMRITLRQHLSRI